MQNKDFRIKLKTCPKIDPSKYARFVTVTLCDT